MYSDIKIIETQKRQDNVLHLKTERPKGFHFKAGQAVELTMQIDGWENVGRPFAIISSPQDDYLSFIIKAYASQAGFVRRLFQLEKGDLIMLSNPFGSIHYEEKGVFIAGGIGIAPFLSIFQDLKYKNKLQGNHLFFATRTKNDILFKEELEALFGENFHIILSDEKTEEYHYGFITKEIIKNTIEKIQGTYFYLCGPPPMIDASEEHLANLSVDKKYIIT